MQNKIQFLKKTLKVHDINLSTGELTRLAQIVTHQHIKKNQNIIQEHVHSENLFIVVQGAFRYYYQFDNEKETTLDFAFTGNVASCLGNILTKTPAYCTVAALRDSEVLQFSYHQLIALYKTSHDLETVGRIIIEKAYIWLDKNYRRLLITDAKDRYLDLLVNNPQLLQDVPLKYLASYLNINQQHLSRIRKELFQ